MPITLATGFTPDPLVRRGTAGGEVDASTMNPTCRGWVGSQPNHVLMASTPFSSLQILVNAGIHDTTLVVQMPDGSYVCDDDGGEGHNPAVQISTRPGLHRVWVGAYHAGTSAEYALGFSELSGMSTSSIEPPAGANQVEPSAAALAALDLSGQQSNFGAVTLRPGFTPDPHVTQGTSGSSADSAVDATSIAPLCRGHITRTPDHLFVAAAPFEQLAIGVRGDGDTTLVIHRPDGSFLCDDDGGEGRNPLITDAFPAGTYPIWVGSYERGQNHGYTLGFSELPGFNTNKL